MGKLKGFFGKDSPGMRRSSCFIAKGVGRASVRGTTTLAELPSTLTPWNNRGNVTSNLQEKAVALNERTPTHVSNLNGKEKGGYRQCKKVKAPGAMDFADLHPLMCQRCMERTHASRVPLVGFPSVINMVMALAGGQLHLSKQQHRNAGLVQGAPTHNALSTPCQTPTLLEDSCRRTTVPAFTREGTGTH
ncbi:unnamed protein product [Pleuronectes platessa]|uniref:Uncharacterized protein n=1 Tax=Pleuronectes platessa TaxID=8262 RepID=A0A9N7W1A7_PLEPL|nr:unnamed protein product [Pleuronectes platessa]